MRSSDPNYDWNEHFKSQSERWHEISEGDLERNPNLQATTVSRIREGDRFIEPADVFGGGEIDVTALEVRGDEGDQIPILVRYMKDVPAFSDTAIRGNTEMLYFFPDDRVYKYI